MVSSFEITIESRKSKEIDLYSDYTKNKLQELTLAAITSVWISLQSWDLAYSITIDWQISQGIFLALQYLRIGVLRRFY